MNTIQSVNALPSFTTTTYMYQVTYIDGTVSFVPADSVNTDYVAINAWIAAGGTVE